MAPDWTFPESHFSTSGEFDCNTHSWNIEPTVYVADEPLFERKNSLSTGGIECTVSDLCYESRFTSEISGCGNSLRLRQCDQDAFGEADDDHRHLQRVPPFLYR